MGCGGDSPDDCENSRGNFYNPNSTGALPLGGTFLESFSGFQEPQIQGYLYSDSVSFPDTPGTIHANSPTILNIAQIDYWVGLLPLNPTKNSVSDPSNKHPSLLECLKRDRQIPSLSWGYTAGAKYSKFSFFPLCNILPVAMEWILRWIYKRLMKSRIDRCLWQPYSRRL